MLVTDTAEGICCQNSDVIFHHLLNLVISFLKFACSFIIIHFLFNLQVV